MYQCNLTQIEIQEPLHVSQGDLSITSMVSFQPGKTEVYFSDTIGHIVTKPPMNIQSYYDTEYTFSIDSEDDDQLYVFADGKQVYRLEHQAQTLFKKLPLQSGSKVLDYGCAKGGVMKKLANSRNDVTPYLFDVSEMYVPFWEKFAKPNQWSSYTIKPEWKNYFDAVTSFFVLEHVENPIHEVLQMREALKDDGILYFIVPNVYKNKIDFIISDHLSHFSRNSLTYLLVQTGFELLSIDEDSHNAAFIVMAKKTSKQLNFSLDQTLLANNKEAAKSMAKFWQELQAKINDFEATVTDKEVAIYGGGVYGNFIASSLKNVEKVSFFVDQNKFLQGKTILGKPIIAPNELPEHIKTIYIGLNPVGAKNNIAKIETWTNRHHEYFYID
jgi:2-polyprenyl-3-methyl-5-hydroxy-6-metoxy-1,4-benzoquinol methylase